MVALAARVAGTSLGWAAALELFLREGGRPEDCDEGEIGREP